MIIQIYEVENPSEAQILAKIGVDHIGVLVGKGKYPRELDFKKTKDIFDVVPYGVKKVALTLEDNFDEIVEVVEKTKPDILHIGTLLEKFSPDQTRKLKSLFPDIEIMRAVPVIDDSSVALAKAYEGIADFLLLDTYKKEDTQIGATGQTHDWNVSKKIADTVRISVILAGGLGPDNVAEAIKFVRPTGVDSKTKTDKTGSHEKDIDKVKAFVNAAKSALR